MKWIIEYETDTQCESEWWTISDPTSRKSFICYHKEDANWLCNKLNNEPSPPITGGELAERIFKRAILEAMDTYSNELIKERDELKAWKESAISVTPPMQEIGKLIGVKLGESIHDKILPAITQLQSENEHWKQLAEGLKAEDTLHLYGIEILKKLCRLKHYKDTVGKDAVYEREQLQTWREANAFIETIEGAEALKQTQRIEP